VSSHFAASVGIASGRHHSRFADESGTEKAASPFGKAALKEKRVICRYLQLRNSVAARIRHPDVSAVERQGVGAGSHSEIPKGGAIDRPQLGHRAAPIIRYSDVSSVKNHGGGDHSHVEGAEYATIACTQLDHVVAAIV
jgi:hypothetical protein